MIKIEKPSDPGQRRQLSYQSSGEADSSGNTVDQKGKSDKEEHSGNDQEIRFSVVTTETGILTKKMYRENGTLIKDSSGCRMFA